VGDDFDSDEGDKVTTHQLHNIVAKIEEKINKSNSRKDELLAHR
jgi:hypothetical protein